LEEMAKFQGSPARPATLKEVREFLPDTVIFREIPSRRPEICGMEKNPGIKYPKWSSSAAADQAASIFLLLKKDMTMAVPTARAKRKNATDPPTAAAPPARRA
jgi:hypothetical protein